MSRFELPCSALVVVLLAAAALADEPGEAAAGKKDRRFPVLAWGGPPWTETTAERYRELADAGFTHNYSGAPNADGLARMLDVAHAQGVKLLAATPELAGDPEATARRFKDHPALGGYYLRDEPGARAFAELAASARRVQAVDAKHPCYVNLFPNYATPAQLEVADYPTYVDRFVAEVPVPMLSFDHYPVILQGGERRLRPEWYQNLEICSAAARGAERPLWAFVLSVAHDPYPVPTLADLRVQAFGNLAYGAQALQYFTYWTIESDTWNFHEGPIGIDGQRTAVYDRVKQVNAEVHGLADVFLGSRVVAVGHAGADPPAGTRPYVPSAPVASLTTVAKDGRPAGAVVSLLENGERRFLVVVNRDLHAPLSLNVAFEAGKPVDEVTKDGRTRPVAGGDYAAEVEPGDVRVLGWSQKQ